MSSYVLDTNIISFILQKRRDVIIRWQRAASSAEVIWTCPIVWHEVHRGLLSRDAQNRLHSFHELFSLFSWDDMNRQDWLLASSLWSQRRQQGIPIGDADLFIAAFTLNRNAILVTDNEKDFVNLGLRMENWLI